jgi:hypothetical protein
MMPKRRLTTGAPRSSGHCRVRNDRKRNIRPRQLGDEIFNPEETANSSIVWIIFITPGKLILWAEYLFPQRVGDVFGSARRKKSPIIEIAYSITFYIVLLAILVVIIHSYA